MIKPTILEEKIFKLLGCIFYGDPFHLAKEWTYENEIGKLWQRFAEVSYKYSILLKKICADINIGYEIHIEPEEYKETRNYYVMVGMEVNNFDEIPLEMFAKVLPKTNYVVFTTTMDEKFKTGSYLYKKWMPEHNYEQAFPYVLQLYDRIRYKGLDDPKSEIDWFIPIKEIGI